MTPQAPVATPPLIAAPPLIDAAALRMAGRAPAVPFRVALGDGRELTMLRLLRVLPHKRVVGESLLDGRRVLAKLFIDKDSARHREREHRGIGALAAAGIPTPATIAAPALPGGGHLLLTEFLDDATTLLDHWRPLAACPPGEAAAIALLAPAFSLLGRLHRAGLAHDDLHFGNFLLHDGQLHLIDGDAVTCAAAPLAAKPAARDLAMLIAQLPRTWDGSLAPLLDAYRDGGAQAIDATVLARALRHERAWRLRDYLDKSGRDCTLFRVRRSVHRFEAVVRGEADTLAPILADPDSWIAAGKALKRGNTCTVARVELDGRPLVIKRYNLKHLGHAISRAWRPTRAWHSWREGHRLSLFGIPTPRPLALIEERWGPLRARAWLVTEYCGGPDMLAHLAPDTEPAPAEAASLRVLFETLYRERISHGDLKATNLLWDGSQALVIDLDAACQHATQTGFHRAWRRDRARFLRNWPAESPLHRWLDAMLPGRP
ncbi:lipopolysaccharide kinase InaA family protein [Aromatoleum toluclasticum]|uniref:lipopolysaccharide kinase InaA family protein n=1 Tax=Aromatoleum toluclasticum TaxID=92003 RepID=UPI0012FA907C|nr:lipopolysaccharide kinase InaA family protein [Aromatoleum toluclasticum]